MYKHILVLFFLPTLAFTQLDRSAVVDEGVPDFGGVFGTWGQIHYYRPFGVRGVLLQDWKDLDQSHPLSGEPFNTDRQGWLPYERHTSVWEQFHPELTSPADTSAPSLLVNYKQGDYLYRDFNVWYHNSLGPYIRYGWFSKLRSQTRATNYSGYDEQRHHLQVNAEIGDQRLRMEASYKHQINPLYAFHPDTSGTWQANDSIKFQNDRWEGEILWTNRDSLGAGTELFGSLKSGDWRWYLNHERSFNTLAYVAHYFRLYGDGLANIQIGYKADQLGSRFLRRPLFQFTLPTISTARMRAEVGLRYLEAWYPHLETSYLLGKYKASYQTRQIVSDHLLVESLQTTLLHAADLSRNGTRSSLVIGGWSGNTGGADLMGYHAAFSLRLPWKMEAGLSASTVELDSSQWLLGRQQFQWRLQQELLLLDKALLTRLEVWGRHVFDPEVGLLDVETYIPNHQFRAESPAFLHLLNYTINIQVSSLILGFTDTNVLHDPIWSQAETWDPQYDIMLNQIPEIRYRYLSLMWVFDN